LLNKTIVNKNGSITDFIFPAIDNGFTGYVNILETPYILDSVADTIWRWDDALEYWVDLNESLTLPLGEYSDITNINGNLVLSTDNGAESGLWHIGLTSYQLTNVELQGDEGLVFTSQGIMQLHLNGNNQYELNQLGGSQTTVLQQVDSDKYVYWKSVYGETGALLLFMSEAGPQYIWGDDDGFNTINTPDEIIGVLGCYSSYPEVFCALLTDENEVVLYEVKNGEFRADTVIGQRSDFESAQIISVLASGKKRFLSIRFSKGYGVRHHLKLFGTDNVDFGVTLDSLNTRDLHYLFKSKESGVIYWMGILSDAIIVNKFKSSGELEFLENSISSREGVGQEQDESTSDSDLIGSINTLFLIAMMLIMIKPKNRKHMSIK